MSLEKIDFKDYPDETTPIDANNLNQVQTNVENALNEEKSSREEAITSEQTAREEAINNVKIQKPTLYVFTKKSGSITLNAWATMCEDLSVDLEVGEYLLIFCAGITGSASGLTTFNPVVGGSRTAIHTRNSVPIGNSLQTNAQCKVPLTVETAKQYTFNIHEYANAAHTVSTAGLYIYKLS